VTFVIAVVVAFECDFAGSTRGVSQTPEEDLGDSGVSASRDGRACPVVPTIIQHPRCRAAHHISGEVFLWRSLRRAALSYTGLRRSQIQNKSIHGGRRKTSILAEDILLGRDLLQNEAIAGDGHDSLQALDIRADLAVFVFADRAAANLHCSRDIC